MSGRTISEVIFFDAHPYSWHPQDRCQGTHCVIHNPSAHPMRSWPMNIRETALIERLCRHSIGHPDPDSWRAMNRLDYGNAEIDYGYQIHGCDGCCTAALQATSTHTVW